MIIPLLHKRGNAHRQKWKWKVILNALFYVLRTGCQWRELPDSFPPWQTIYAYHRRFCKHGVWERLNTALRIRLRLKSQRKAWPSAVVFDTQSVKALCGGEERGFDGYKRVNGRKRPSPSGAVFGPRQRFLLVDTLGLLLSVKVVPANTAETVAAMRGLETLGETYAGVSLAWADKGFGGAPFRTWLKDTLGWDLELTSGISKPGKPDFEVAPRRWVVERTIAWLCRHRRLLCDFERLVQVGIGWMYAAMTLLMVRCLAR